MLIRSISGIRGIVETSLTRELSLKYYFSNDVSFKTTAYKGTISDVLNRGTATNGYNEIIITSI